MSGKQGKAAPTAAGCALLLAVSLASCSGTPAEVDFRQTTTGTPAATMPTLRITEQVTAVVTTTATITQKVPVTTTATTSVTVTMTPAPPTYTPLSTVPGLPSVRTELDRALADEAARAIVADVAAIDELFAGTEDVSARLDALDRNLATLVSAGVPPGLDGPSYIGRILSLRVFTVQAARDAPANRPAARSRWDVIRPELATLLAQVTLGLGTPYTLPPPPPPTS